MATRPAVGGGRTVEVPPERLRRWLENFAARHGGPPVPERFPGGLRLRAPDDTLAECALPYGGTPDDCDSLVANAVAPRRTGLLLVRRGGCAVGIADGPRLLTSKVERRYVQGRTAAGGWSQQRFARRRENQARKLGDTAADLAARLLLPELDRIVVLVVGGDRRAVDGVLSDPRLVRLADKRGGWFLPVAEPRQAVLAEAAAQARTVRIRLVDPDEAG